MRSIKAKSATIILVLLWLLFGLVSISNAENIPLSEEGLAKIGVDKVRLESGMGVLVFNLSKDEYSADGYLTVSNTYNTSIVFSCQIVTKLSAVDLDQNSSPRIHSLISDKIVFDSIPDDSWVVLKDTNVIVEPCCIYNFRYTVNLPRNRGFDNDKGYLVYINIKKDLGDVSGANIGINYNYKLFIILTGKQEQSSASMGQWMFIPLLFVIGATVFVVYRWRHKKTVVDTHKKITDDIVEDVDKPVNRPIIKPVTDHDDIQHRIDHLLTKNNDDMFRRRDM